MTSIQIYLIKRKLIELDLVRKSCALVLLLSGKIAYGFNAKLGFHMVSKAARLTSSDFIIYSALSSYRKGGYIPSFEKPETQGQFGSRVFLLKEKTTDGEKGVVLLKFNSTIRDFPLFVDMNKFSKDYYLVIEPSWTGLFIDEILQYTKFNFPIWVLSAYEKDYELLTAMQSNLIPVRLGPCDWVDPEATASVVTTEKKYDIVFNSNWASWKRHHILFSALKRINKPLKVALIGVEWEGRTKRDIEDLAEYFGVSHLLEIHERIPYANVLRITAASKCALLLSLKEGSNRALAEAMMCNTPVILLKNHIGGIHKNVTTETGVLAAEDKLCEAIEQMVENYQQFSPRYWAIHNASCFISTEILNNAIMEYAKSNYQPWHANIWVRTNSPEPQYVDKTLNKEELCFNYAKYKIN